MTELREGQTIKVEGLMTPITVERDGERFYAVGPRGGVYELVEINGRVRAKMGTSTRDVRFVDE